MIGPLEDALSERGGLPSTQRVRLEVAHNYSLRLLKLVITLLDFSRMKAGQIEASYEPRELAELTAGLASVFLSACWIEVSCQLWSAWRTVLGRSCVNEAS